VLYLKQHSFLPVIIRKFWQSNKIGNKLLLPISFIYLFIFKLRKKYTKPYRSSSRIICVGNIVTGGAGKTPVSISLGNIIKSKSFKYCFLSKGYKGYLKGPLMVHNSHTARQVGDEALLLSQTAPVIMAKNRLQGIKFAEQKGYKIIVVDDGFQNPTFIKDLNLLVVDANFKFGNELLLPAGPLREPIYDAFNNADIILKMGSIKDDRFIKNKVLSAEIQPVGNQDIPKRVIAFAGIGNPEKFFSTLVSIGVDVVETYSFPDHYNYSKHDIKKLIETSDEEDAVLMTTEKDYVKIPNQYKKKIRFLKVDVEWQEKDKIEKLLFLKILDI
jgi:tetraacyldisaccharide 4'-kinase